MLFIVDNYLGRLSCAERLLYTVGWYRRLCDLLIAGFTSKKRNFDLYKYVQNGMRVISIFHQFINVLSTVGGKSCCKPLLPNFITEGVEIDVVFFKCSLKS